MRSSGQEKQPSMNVSQKSKLAMHIKTGKFEVFQDCALLKAFEDQDIVKNIPVIFEHFFNCQLSSTRSRSSSRFEPFNRQSQTF